MEKDDDIAAKLARAIAGGARIDWSSLGLDPSSLGPELENLKRLSRLSSSFDRHTRLSDAPTRPRAGRAASAAGASGSRSAGQLSDTPMATWGDLEILGRLGQGSFGEVFLAFDPVLEREVALKLWKAPAVEGKRRLERSRQTRRFLEEAKRIAKIRHPGVVVVHGAGVHRGAVGIWTERLTGETLSEHLAKVGTLPAEDVVRLGVEIASALGAVHAASLVHGDVKDANVVIEESGRIVLIDFGSGRTLGAPDPIEPLSSTPRYAAPEVLLDGESPGVPSDLYAFGVLLHRAAFGNYPVDGVDLSGLMEQHKIRRGRMHTTEAGGAEASALGALVSRMIAPNAEDRPQSAKAVLRELRFLLERSMVPESVVAMPRSTNRFFGRARELAEIAAALATERAVTLVGPGGCGKSRLVLETVGPLRPNYADGVAWVRLARLRSEHEIVPAILGAAGMTAGADADREALILRLASRQILLVLDNAEHLADPVRKLIEEILSGTTDVTILTTSRRTLGGAFEKLIRLEPLPTESEGDDVIAPAIALFADRAQRRDSDFDLARSRPAVERICRRLEGIPLAIELAAARAAAVSPEEIANQLDRPLDLGADPGGSSRHSSLRASVAWSHDLLPPEARETFRDLSVFGGGWETEAAIAIVDLPDFLVRESLATLVEHSLIRRERNVPIAARYSMLETVREFGEVRLRSAPDADEVSARHAAYYRDLFLREAPAIVSYDHPRALDCSLRGVDHPSGRWRECRPGHVLFPRGGRPCRARSRDDPVLAPFRTGRCGTPAPA
ncbi:MAG: protein kinase [Candidatus Eisenbacteria bacterium]